MLGRRVNYHFYQPEEDDSGLRSRPFCETTRPREGNCDGASPSQTGWEFDCYCAAAAAAYLFLKGEDLAAQNGGDLEGFDRMEFVDTQDHWEAAGRAARTAGYRSCQGGGPGGHWWLEFGREDRPDRWIIDTNIGIDDTNDDCPYEEGAPRGFMMTGYKRPAGKAKEIIRRVKTNRRKKAALAP